MGTLMDRTARRQAEAERERRAPDGSWRRGKSRKYTGQPVTRELVERVADEEIAALGGDPADYAQARALFMEVAVADDFVEFLTLPAYELID